MTPVASSLRRLLPRPAPGRAGRGFTLIELLVTIALAAILTSLAAPSMTSMLRANRIQTEASQLLGDLQYARTEAVKRGLPVSLCPSSNGSSCVVANTWQVGWLVFVDTNANGSYGNGDTILRIGKAFRGGDTAAALPTLNYLSFNRDGFTTGLGTTTTMLQIHTSDNKTQQTRCISVDLSGRMTTLRYNDTTAMGGTCK